MTRPAASEEAVAAARVILGLTLAVGGMSAAIGVTAGSTLVLLGPPTLLLAIALLLGRVGIAGWAGVATWLTLLPHAAGEALVAPLVMALLCLALAIGPDRMLRWAGRDAVGPRASAAAATGWIEEDGRPLD